MNKFEALGLSDVVVKAVAELGFESPTPIQEKTIPLLLAGSEDLVALAQTGTGKTAAFGLPLTSLVDFTNKDTQAIILCPTRELCIQITKDISAYTKNIRGANVVSIYGGASIEGQIREVNRGANIIVATPGRMNDMINRKRVDLSNIRYAVLDEADEMLNMGFKEDLDNILSRTPEEKNTWLFSATMPNEVLRISKEYMTNPVEITAGTKNSGNENIEHVYYVVNGRDKYMALKRIADTNPNIFAIVFCRTRRETQEVAEKMIKDGYNADAIHGDLSQAQRDHVMGRYRNRTLNILVATDVAARGIDVSDVTHVINYNLPDEIENYTHRSGRTARAGKKGISICIINPRETGKIRQIERIIKAKFKQEMVPTGIQACEAQLFKLVKRVHDVKVNETDIEQYMPKIYEELNDLSKEEIIKRFVSTEFNRYLEYYKNAPDLNNMSGGGDRRSENGMVKLFVTLGEMDNLTNDGLKEFISEVSDVPLSSFSNITVKNTFSFVEVKEGESAKIISAFKDAEHNGRRVKIEMRSGNGPSRGGGGGGGRRRFEGGGSRSGGGSDRRRRSDGGGGGGRSYGGDRSGDSPRDRPRGEFRERSKPDFREGNRSSSRETATSERSTSGNRKGNFTREKRPRKKF